MATEDGIVGSNVGPTPGDTPTNDSDLHTSANPYSNGLGSPSADLNRQLVYGAGADSVNLTADDVARQTPWQVSAPYFANPPAAGNNPHSATGAPTKSEPGDQATSAGVADSLDNLYSHTIGQYEGAGFSNRGYAWQDSGPVKPETIDPQYIGNENYDEGFGKSGEGRS